MLGRRPLGSAMLGSDQAFSVNQEGFFARLVWKFYTTAFVKNVLSATAFLKNALTPSAYVKNDINDVTVTTYKKNTITTHLL